MPKKVELLMSEEGQFADLKDVSFSQSEAGVPLLVPGLNRALYHWDGIKLEVHATLVYMYMCYMHVSTHFWSPQCS